MQKEVKFEDIPELLKVLEGKVDRILEGQGLPEFEEYIDVDTLVKIDPLKRGKATWMAKIRAGEVPHYRDGRAYYFKRKEIAEYMESRRR